MTRISIIMAALAAASVALGGVVPLDPHSEEPLREQIARAVQSGPTTAPTTAQSMMADVDQQLAAIDREVQRVRALGEPAKPRADRLQRRLNELRERRNGKAFPTSDQPELHMVVVHGNPAEANKHLPPAQRRRQFKAARTPVTVEVQPIGRPIVLVVCSYGPTQWDVRIANDANVKRVIVGGYETQQITGVPENVPVEVHTYEGPRRSAHHFYTMGRGTEGHDAAMAKLRAQIGRA